MKWIPILGKGFVVNFLINCLYFGSPVQAKTNVFIHLPRQIKLARPENLWVATDFIKYGSKFVGKVEGKVFCAFLGRWNFKNRFNEQEIKSGLVDFIMRALCIADAKRKK